MSLSPTKPPLGVRLPPKPKAAPLRNKGGRPKSEAPKQLITLRLPPAIIEHFKAMGPGWQGEVEATLASAMRGERATVADLDIGGPQRPAYGSRLKKR